MGTVFISHSSKDDALVRRMRQALADLGQQGWIDSRELHGGDPLEPAIKEAIEDAAGFLVVVSPDSLQSRWVGKELSHAIDVQRQRGRDAYPVVPLLLDNCQLGAFEFLLGEEPITIPLSSAAGGIEAALDPILVALGRRLPSDPPLAPQPPAPPVEELVLELSRLSIRQEADGKRGACAEARLRYQPATDGQPDVVSTVSWRLMAPLGPIEAEELRWYLESYPIWPSETFQRRAGEIEAKLIDWGQQLHGAAMPIEPAANVLRAWARIAPEARRRFSIQIDDSLILGASDDEKRAAREARTDLLGLPWELLQDGEAFLFQGATATRVRRRLPNTSAFAVPVLTPPIRILLVSPRPEDDACGYINHRASALPLVEAAETLPGLVELHSLDPGTFGAMADELERARRAGTPYHVVHFDGHGIYDRQHGLGGLCFEDPRDTGKLSGRRHVVIHTTALGPLLRDHRIPLVLLEACQSAMAETASESVATALLQSGVASVVAMSHSVLVETSRRFVAAFYGALARGERVGDAMLCAQKELHRDPSRGSVFGAGELRLADWFVPVLYQEENDPQLFTSIPNPTSFADANTTLRTRLGTLPDPPAAGFIGRSRELLALERLLRHHSYAVLRGQGGEGKTALAVELARWMVRSQQIQRAAFVCVEGIERNITEVVLDRLGEQLIESSFSTATTCNGDLDLAAQEMERILKEQPTLLLLDNMESLLPAPEQGQAQAQGEADLYAQEAAADLAALLALCERLNRIGTTRLLFTCREWLPAPFALPAQRLDLRRLSTDDAVALIETILSRDPQHKLEPARGTGQAMANAEREEIEALVLAVNGHARSLTLLGPALITQGVAATRTSLAALMAQMERRVPGSREQSLFASVELSLRRLSEANRIRVRELAVCQGGIHLGVLRTMDWSGAEVVDLAEDLGAKGLATRHPYNHLGLDPALGPYLFQQLSPSERSALRHRWTEAMAAYLNWLHQQQSQNTHIANSLTLLDLPNLMALLEHTAAQGEPGTIINQATSLYSLVQFLGRPRLMARVAAILDAATRQLGEHWTRDAFEAERTRIQQLGAAGQWRQAVQTASTLLERARAAGVDAYDDADYDLAMAHIVLGRMLLGAGLPHQALPLLQEARQRFDAIAQASSNRSAALMASIGLIEIGDALRDLNKLDGAAKAYEDAIVLNEQLDAQRDVAVGKAKLATLRHCQGRHKEALEAHLKAKQIFEDLNEPASVAAAWHQIGMVYQKLRQPQAAEDAYRHSLAIGTPLDDQAGRARTLGQLGNLYRDLLQQPEQAAAFYQQTAAIFRQLGDLVNEGLTHQNLALMFLRLGRLQEARQEILRAIDYKQAYAHAGQLCEIWRDLCDIETAAVDGAAAAQARHMARECYLAYRRDGGENTTTQGQVMVAITPALLAGQGQQVREQIQAWLRDGGVPETVQPFLRALEAIAAGSLDPALADDPQLLYHEAAEILLLLEQLRAGEQVEQQKD